ncbi:uncharacterized protein [Rutidosis leptorrhynchoides]|uniref:uncharacterized protein n=1 Tax=Rutidosis leptorrhynchoides TaxID=125765 RepID=UPI003A9A43FF
MVSKKTKTRRTESELENDDKNGDGGVAEYEQSREQRIKENLERMHKLGILDLSRNLKPTKTLKPKVIRTQKPPSSSSASPRRSSRIKTIPSVCYVEKREKKEKVIKDVIIVIKEGSKPEVYTEEHEKMLGDYKETWTLMVDGYDDEGNRMYDAYDGKSCHQCRQKTIGLRTKCSKCKGVQGQFCGDCLFTRYGENVLEATANRNWVCPVCRDICNCSRCRRVKGWEPTGNLYRKALKLGFKSVAHYLIHTRGPHGKQEEITDVTLGSPSDKEDDNMDDDTKHAAIEENIKHQDQLRKEDDDDDSDYKSDPLDDDNDDDNDDEDDSSETD